VVFILGCDARRGSFAFFLGFANSGGFTHIGHGLGPRVTPSYDDLLPIKILRNCAEA